jgi:hypothetical protein
VVKRATRRRGPIHEPPILPEFQPSIKARLRQKVAESEVRCKKRPRVAKVARVAKESVQSSAYVTTNELPKVRKTAPPSHQSGPAFGPRRQAQGKLMSPSACVDFHPFVETLEEWETGVPVDCGEAWEWATVEAAVAQGAHKSATSPESIALVKEDVAYQVKAGYAEVIPWNELRKLRPPTLKVSPLAVVPQRNRRGRMILDLSFAVQRQQKRGRRRKRRRDDEDVLQASVNDTTVQQAPEAPVKELGNVLPRILDFMAKVPEEEHIHFAKLDLADGYWRMVVEREARWNFAYVMPDEPGAELMVVIPSALQMGWNESPAYFCATTETVRDVAQAWIDNDTSLPRHAMEDFATPTVPARRQPVDQPPYQMSSVYVDDHIMAAVEDSTGTLLERTARATLHAIHSVFQPPDVANAPSAKDPISEKKLLKGDGRWDTKKEILGYMLDGINRTIQLPKDRANDLLKEVKAILKKQRVQLKRFRSIVGRLQHAARILPAARAFFTPLYNALKGTPDFVGLSRTGEVRHAMLDVAVVIRDLSHRPTHISELTQQILHYTGYCDASAWGAGGVWFGAKNPLSPIVWRVQWPKDITDAVVSDRNPKGRITNSDLEMAGVLLQETVLEARLGHAAMQGVQMAIGSDNSPAVAWTTRMASRSQSPISYRLLKGFAMRQRTTRAAPPAVFHVAGTENTLADVASRVVPNVASLPGVICPETFLTHFNTLYALPQRRSWHNVQPPLDLWLNVIATLRGRPLTLQQWTKRSDENISSTGPPMQSWPGLTPGSATIPKPQNKSASFPSPPGFELESMGMRSKLDTSLWKRPCVTWHKPSSWLDSKTLGKPQGQPTSTCHSSICSEAIKTLTHPPSPN